MEETDRLIIFDGVCGLCHTWVRLVIRYDRHTLFRFTSIQSSEGQKALRKMNLSGGGMDSVLYVENGQVYQKSLAFLRIARLLPFPARLLCAFSLIPCPIRDAAYDFIAKSRYRLFGKREECMLTKGEFKDRFL